MRPCHRHDPPPGFTGCLHCQDTGRCDCTDEAIEREAQADADFRREVLATCVCGGCEPPSQGTCVASLLATAANEAEDTPWQYR